MKLYRNKEWLYKKYIKEEFSANEISSVVNVSCDTILRWLKYHKIPTRNQAESTKTKRSRKKLSAILMGREVSKKTRGKISQTLKGRKLSPDRIEAIKKIGFKKGYTPWNKGLPKEKQPMYGKTGENHPSYGKPGYWKGKKNLKQNEKIRGKNLREKSSNWKGGRYKSFGHILILNPSHPNCNKQGYVRESRLIAAKVLGRYLKSTEIVHHTNENPSDNRNCNLLVCDRAYHNWLHKEMRIKQ